MFVYLCIIYHLYYLARPSRQCFSIVIDETILFDPTSCKYAKNLGLPLDPNLDPASKAAKHTPSTLIDLNASPIRHETLINCTGLVL